MVGAMPLRRLYDFMASTGKTLHLSFMTRRLIRINVKVREGLRHDEKGKYVTRISGRFFTPKMLGIDVTYICEEALQLVIPDTCEIEFMAYVGFVIPATENIVVIQPLKINEELFCLYCHMSRTRFKQFANIITFDDKTTRRVHREEDNFHAICEFHLYVCGLFGAVISLNYTVWRQNI
jgi:hypothetical protein